MVKRVVQWFIAGSLNCNSNCPCTKVTLDWTLKPQPEANPTETWRKKDPMMSIKLLPGHCIPVDQSKVLNKVLLSCLNCSMEWRQKPFNLLSIFFYLLSSERAKLAWKKSYTGLWHHGLQSCEGSFLSTKLAKLMTAVLQHCRNTAVILTFLGSFPQTFQRRSDGKRVAKKLETPQKSPDTPAVAMWQRRAF